MLDSGVVEYNYNDSDTNITSGGIVVEDTPNSVTEWSNEDGWNYYKFLKEKYINDLVAQGYIYYNDIYPRVIGYCEKIFKENIKGGLWKLERERIEREIQELEKYLIYQKAENAQTQKNKITTLLIVAIAIVLVYKMSKKNG